jgi:TRAP-type C4-dicarboxylate transport system permease small subunit
MQSIRTRLRFFAELVTAFLFVAMFAAFLLQVFTRYVLNDPIAWTQEFVLIVYIWIVFWCAAFLLRERDHITFDMLFISLPLGLRRVLAVILTLLTLVAFVAVLPGTIDYVSFMKIERSPVLGIRFDILYSIFAVFAVAVAIGALVRLRRLFGRSWQDELKTEGEIEP